MLLGLGLRLRLGLRLGLGFPSIPYYATLHAFLGARMHSGCSVAVGDFDIARKCRGTDEDLIFISAQSPFPDMTQMAESNEEDASRTDRPDAIGCSEGILDGYRDKAI